MLFFLDVSLFLKYGGLHVIKSNVSVSYFLVNSFASIFNSSILSSRLFSLIDSLRKLFSIKFLKGLILLIITAAFVAAMWFMWKNVPF